MFALLASTLLAAYLITGTSARDDLNYNDPAYAPPPSVGHEIGIMFGFVGAMLLSMVLYTLAWQVGNKRSAQREATRVQELRKAGYLESKGQRGGWEEKDEGMETRE
ncbi:hypothetical protein EV356DRAFT_504099 [Viridothelium virens]|uniref:Dolichol phosphate-mannose biosynthesis regulatory protein n=1 Tax=Viridothelium virens TaxID=1048519 RepID=A0A6A6HL62_VIRVR|nr:hypothetical protein EV356DRAFT_504099 [Viridothelium virens]